MADSDFIPDSQFVPDSQASQPSAAPQPSVDQQPQASPNQPDSDFVPDSQFVSDEDKYGTPGQQLKAGLEGIAKGIAGPLATGIEIAAGVKPEDIRGREEENKLTHAAGETAGFLGSLATGVGEGKIISEAGEAAKAATGLGKAESTIGSKILGSGVQGAAETALIQSGDEVSKMIDQDPNQSYQSALTNIGLASALGGGFGSVTGAVSPLWKATIGNKAGKVIEDFKARLNEHITNPEPIAAAQKELEDYYSAVKSVADPVYGAQGLKAQDIVKAVPEMNSKIAEQTQAIADKLDGTIKKMVADPDTYPARLTKKLQGDVNQYLEIATNPESKSVDIFNATQDLKQTLQGYAKFDKRIAPFSEEAGFVSQAKNTAYDIRKALEDPDVWGKAADRQMAINDAFKKYLPTLEDFESKFTTEIADPENGGFKRIVDPGKVATYMNQAGKPSAEIKQQMVRNFIDASEKYRDVIADTHSNLGLDSPMPFNSLNTIKSTLKEQTAGSKLADVLVKRGLAKVGGSSIGAAIGGGLGHAIGLGGIGAVVGEHALGPFFSSVLPALAKPILKNATDAEGAKAAIDYAMNVAKGDKLVTKSVKNLFKAGEVLPSSALPTEKDRTKLTKILDEMQKNPEVAMDSENKTSHYLPDHGSAIASTNMNAVNFLNSIRPEVGKKAPLDQRLPVASNKIANYNRALDIAQQPLVVLDSIKSGRIKASDVMAIQRMYPSLYAGIQQKITDEIANATDKGINIPYAQRRGLSIFMGQPMDSTMLPQAIAAAQPLPADQPGPQQVPQRPKHSMTALNKLPQSFQTPNQAAEQRRMKS